MKRRRFVISAFFLGLLLIGCASTSVDKKGEERAGGTPEDKTQTVQDFDNIGISEFVLGVGDTIDISVYRNDDLKKTFKIDPSGIMMFPLIGDVRVDGRSATGLRDEMKEKLSRYLVDPQVSISVSSLQSRKIIVLGEVRSPGVFSLDSNINIAEAVAKAGGLTDEAKSTNIMLIRKSHGKTEALPIDFSKTLQDDGFSQDTVLRGGDIVYVPRVAIADVSWFFSHLGQIFSPIVNLESGIVLWPQVIDVFQGETVKTPLTIPAN